MDEVERRSRKRAVVSLTAPNYLLDPPAAFPSQPASTDLPAPPTAADRRRAPLYAYLRPRVGLGRAQPRPTALEDQSQLERRRGMAEAELNSQASGAFASRASDLDGVSAAVEGLLASIAALAAQLLHIGTLLGQVESSAAIRESKSSARRIPRLNVPRTVEHLDDGFWTRIKAAVEMQTLQSHLENPVSPDTAWSGAMQRWIWPELNARCPQPTLRLEPAPSFNESGKRTGFDDLLDSGTFPSLAGPSTASLPPAPPRPPSPPFDSPMFNTTAVSESYSSSNIYTDSYPETYFPPISVPRSASPFFDSAPFAGFSTIDPQLLFQSPPTTNPMTPRLPSIFTSFVAAPFPNGSDILVTTAHGAFDEATTPVSTSKLFGAQSMFDHLVPANGYSSSSSAMIDEYSISGNAGQGTFSGSFDFPPHEHSPAPPEGLGAELPRAASPIPSSVTIAISRSETPPIVERRPSHGRSRSFGSADRKSVV